MSADTIIKNLKRIASRNPKQNHSAGEIKFLRSYRKKLLLIYLFRFLILFLFITAWEVLTRRNIVDSFIFSSPSRLIASAKYYIGDGTLLIHLKVTLLETFACFFIVICGALIFATLFWWFEGLYRVFEPYLVILNSLPKSALAPLFIVWLGTGMRTIIAAAVSVAIFGATISLYEHFNETDKEKVKLIYTLGGNRLTVLTKLVLPANRVFILNIMKVNLGLSLVGVIIGEFIAANAGLGYLILYASQVFKLDLVILSIIILSVIASALYMLLSFMENIISKNPRA